MNAAERAVAYRKALNGQGSSDQVELARICAGLEYLAENAWEGAQLAGVPPEKLRAVIAGGHRPQLAALADLAGEAPSSTVVRYNRQAWAGWNPA